MFNTVYQINKFVILFLLLLVLHERLSERTSGSEIYEEQDFYGRQCVKESMQRSNSGTASTKSNTAVKIPAPSYKAPVVPQKSVYGNRSSKRPAPPVPQVPPRVKVKPALSKGENLSWMTYVIPMSSPSFPCRPQTLEMTYIVSRVVLVFLKFGHFSCELKETGSSEI